MLVKYMILLCFIIFSSTAQANTANDKDPKETEWTAGVSLGTAVIEGSSDQIFASLSLSKDIGDSYLGFTLSHIDSGNVAGLFNAIPASTTRGTLSAGTSFNAVNLDTYISLGKRDFDTESVNRDGNRANINSGGDAFGVGLTVSYDLLLNEQTFLTPAVSVDYNTLDIARVVTGPNGQQIAVGNKEDGVTGSFGLSAQRLFGADDNHLFSLLANVVTTSNTSSFNPGSSQSTVLRALALRDQPGQKDSWAEIGSSLSFGLNRNLRLDFSIIQTIGFLNSDATSLSAGLRQSF